MSTHQQLSNATQPTGAFAVAQQPIAVDENAVDDEFAYGEELSAYSTSLSATAKDYKWTNGRRYHRFKEGSYAWPNDEKEQDRLDMFHQMMLVLCDGALHFAPIRPDACILDMGTGTGIWAIDVADQYPQTQVTGCDLSPIQPAWVPPNIKFVVDDVETDWVGERYDFIRSRYMSGSIRDWPRLVRQCFEHLTPGGWLEFQDADTNTRCDDGSMAPDHAIKRTLGLLEVAMAKVDRVLCVGPKLKGWMEDAGFVNVQEKRLKLPLGTWPKDKKLKELGAFGAVQWIEGAEAFTNVPFTQILQWKKEEVEVLNAEIRKAAKDRSQHIYYIWYIVWGQKPE